MSSITKKEYNRIMRKECDKCGRTNYKKLCQTTDGTEAQEVLFYCGTCYTLTKNKKDVRPVEPEPRIPPQTLLMYSWWFCPPTEDGDCEGEEQIQYIRRTLRENPPTKTYKINFWTTPHSVLGSPIGKEFSREEVLQFLEEQYKKTGDHPFWLESWAEERKNDWEEEEESAE